MKRKREAIPLNRWFPITLKVKHRCCRCGSVHWFSFRTRLEMKVSDRK